MEEKQTKSGWKIAAIVLAVLIVAALAAVVGVFITSSASGGAGGGKSDGKEAELEQVQPSDEEIDVKSTILVTADGSTSEDAGDTAEAGDESASAEHRYEVVAQRMTWAQADAYCKAQGGYLATVGSQEEYDQIIQLADQSGRKVLFLGGQRGSDGNFQWTNGEDFSYTAWMSGEPNNDGGNENCLVMFLVDGQWVWSDVPDDLSSYYGESTVGFVCEWDS